MALFCLNSFQIANMVEVALLAQDRRTAEITIIALPSENLRCFTHGIVKSELGE